jgi:DNA invertase Pin-like site-specific DNA recombinase
MYIISLMHTNMGLFIMRIGYIRVSTEKQNTDRQLDGIQLDKMYEEKVSGKNTNRPALQQLLADVKKGDELFIHEMSRLGRSLQDLTQLLHTLTKEIGITVHFLKENMVFSADETNPMTKFMFNIFASVAEFERELLLERQKEGIEQAKKRGVYNNFGNKPKLSKEQQDDIRIACVNFKLDDVIKYCNKQFSVSISKPTASKIMKGEYK